jgi:hypothetical protein
LTDEPIVLARRSARVVVARAVATLAVGKAGGALRFASVRSAKPVGAQIIATIARSVARHALRFAFDAPAETLQAVEVATLFVGGAREAGGCTSDAATESVGAVEVAAVDGRRAGCALRNANLLGFAEAVLAEQVGAAGFTC